jgi:hypothetical protein
MKGDFVMLKEILDKMKENFRNRILNPLGARLDARREMAEKEMCNFLEVTRDRVVGKGKWQPTEATQAVEDELRSLFDEVVLGYKTIGDFKTACRRWETLGTSQETAIPAEKAGTQTINGTSAEGVNPLISDAKKRAAVHEPGVGRPGTISAPTE